MEIVNAIMMTLFLLFLVFVFGGYHKNKSAHREEQFNKKNQKEKNS